MPSATINGTELYYEVHGQGPALLLVHGMYGNHAAWFQQVPFFSSRARVITLDLRGFGLSRDSNEQGARASVEDVRGLLDYLEIDSAVLVAQSLGGNTCLDFASQYPERVSALVMAGTLGGVVLPDLLQSWQADLTGKAQALSLLQRMFSAQFLADEPVKAELFSQLLTFNTGAGSYLAKGRPEPISFEALTDVTSRLPVLFLVGEHDVVQPAPIVTDVARLLPNVAVKVIGGAGHSAYFEQPGAFNSAVLDFAGESLSGRGSD